MKAQERFLKAAEYLKTHGWRQGRYGDAAFGGPDGAACLIGACLAVDPETRGTPTEGWRGWKFEKMPEYLCLENLCGRAPHNWNDKDGRTFDEVIAKLEEAAEKCAEQS